MEIIARFSELYFSLVSLCLLQWVVFYYDIDLLYIGAVVYHHGRLGSAIQYLLALPALLESRDLIMKLVWWSKTFSSPAYIARDLQTNDGHGFTTKESFIFHLETLQIISEFNLTIIMAVFLMDEINFTRSPNFAYVSIWYFGLIFNSQLWVHIQMSSYVSSFIRGYL